MLISTFSMIFWFPPLFSNTAKASRQCLTNSDGFGSFFPPKPKKPVVAILWLFQVLKQISLGFCAELETKQNTSCFEVYSYLR